MEKTIEGKYFTMKDALEFLASHGIKRSLGWLRIEVLKNKIRTTKQYNSRLIMKEDVKKLVDLITK